MLQTINVTYLKVDSKDRCYIVLAPYLSPYL